jgi:hypothetical protein
MTYKDHLALFQAFTVSFATNCDISKRLRVSVDAD